MDFPIQVNTTRMGLSNIYLKVSQVERSKTLKKVFISANFADVPFEEFSEYNGAKFMSESS